jgi:hypothetical protein
MMPSMPSATPSVDVLGRLDAMQAQMNDMGRALREGRFHPLSLGEEDMMMKREIIARREFTVGRDGKRRLEALVYAPVEGGPDDFRCEYEIREDGVVTTASQDYGVDSMQALILAVRKLGADIITSEHVMKKELYWNDQSDDLGLLLPKSLSDLQT